MIKKDSFKENIKKQLQHWNNRIAMLEEWKAAHDYDHPDWEQNSRDLNNAYIKVQQLNDRLT